MMKMPKSNRMSGPERERAALGVGTGSATSGPDSAYEYEVACQRSIADPRYIQVHAQVRFLVLGYHSSRGALAERWPMWPM